MICSQALLSVQRSTLCDGMKSDDSRREEDILHTNSPRICAWMGRVTILIKPSGIALSLQPSANTALGHGKICSATSLRPVFRLPCSAYLSQIPAPVNAASQLGTIRHGPGAVCYTRSSRRSCEWGTSFEATSVHELLAKPSTDYWLVTWDGARGFPRGHAVPRPLDDPNNAITMSSPAHIDIYLHAGFR